MLKKIDCVMIRVDDVKAAKAYYADVFGLQPVWWDDSSAGLVFPESDAEIVVHSRADIPSKIEVYFLVENVVDAVQSFVSKGCREVIEPFDIAIGKCAVIEDPFGVELCILDMTKGPLQSGRQ
jgi:predicted enzyme related to lactoylglutathione lyase